jgi:hypothetical protein
MAVCSTAKWLPGRTSSTVVQDVAVLLLLITPLLLTTFYQRRDPAIHFCRPQVPYMPLRAASLAVLSLIFAVPSRGGTKKKTIISKMP